MGRSVLGGTIQAIALSKFGSRELHGRWHRTSWVESIGYRREDADAVIECVAWRIFVNPRTDLQPKGLGSTPQIL